MAKTVKEAMGSKGDKLPIMKSLGDVLKTSVSKGGKVKAIKVKIKFGGGEKKSKPKVRRTGRTHLEGP